MRDSSSGWDRKREGEKILIAEDEQAMRELVVEILESAGYTVIAASNGIEAVDAFNKEKNEICLVILDRNMPEMNGDETFRALKKIGLNVPLLISSGSIKDEGKLVGEGVTGLIGKPYSIEELLEKVKSTLEKQKKS
ncbi:MAG TPA: response regulator [Candidatus Acidoferrales bacterium]|nr:response regulator [Candidatus Acidoferrales bacterium]